MVNNTTVEILTKARELIATPEKWTKGAYARDISGKPSLLSAVVSGDLSPMSMCLDGAVVCAKQSFCVDDEIKALGFSNRKDAAIWNDNMLRTHKDVMAKLLKRTSN